MCAHYDPAETSKQCTEDDAERVHDKVNANFCDYFEPSTTAFTGAGHSAEQKARAELEALFGTPSGDRGASKGTGGDDALKDAQALFED